MSKIIKKLVTGVFALAATLLIAAPTKANAAEIPLKVTTGNSIQECGDNLVINEETVTLTENVKNTYIYTFNVNKDSIVNIGINAEIKAGKDYTLINGGYTIYSDRALTKKLSERTNPVSGLQEDHSILNLKKGKYYIKCTVFPYNTSSYGRLGDVPVKFTIQSIPLNKAYSAKFKRHGDKLDFSFVNKISDWMPVMWVSSSRGESVYLNSDELSADDTTWSASTSMFTTDGKSILLRLGEAANRYGAAEGESVDILINPDVYAPRITGFKSGATYKKAVVVKYKDTSKIKSATANGKAFKSGTKFTKPGCYTITVKDIIGNKRTASFTIKK